METTQNPNEATDGGMESTLTRPITDAERIKAIKKAIGNHKLFTDVSAAHDFISSHSEAFDNLAVITPEIDFGEGQVCASVLTQQITHNGSKFNAPRALVLFPFPTLEDFIANDSGAKWVDKMLSTAIRQNVLRGLRDTETVEEFNAELKNIPTSVEAISASGRGGDGADLEAWNAFYTELRTRLLSKNPDLSPAGVWPTKGDTLKCIRSASYALETNGKLEKAGVFKLFAGAMKAVAVANEYDTEQLDEWIAKRDEINLKVPARLDDVTLGTITF